MKELRYAFILSMALFTLSSCGPTLQQRKDDASIHHRLGSVHLNEGNLTDALKELTKAVEIYPDDASFHKDLGLAYFFREMNGEAEREFRKAIELDSKYSEAHVALSALYLNERKWDGAIAESKAALANIFYRTPEFAHYNIGWAYFNKNDYPKALESYRKAVEANPAYAMAYYNMGLVYERMGKSKESIDSYEQALRIAPNFAEGHFSLGLAYLKDKNKAAAKKAFEAVIQLAPDTERAQSAREYIDILK